MKLVDNGTEEKYYPSLIKNGERLKNIKPPKGFTFTGEYICHEYVSHSYNEIRVYAVIKGDYTPCGYLRDCGDHYIKGWYKEWDRIDKITFKITCNVKDE